MKSGHISAVMRTTSQQQLFVADAGAVVDAVVNGDARADVREDRAGGGTCDLVEARDDESLEGALEEPDHRLEGLGIHGELAELLEEGVRLADAADLVRELEPDLGVL